MRTLQSLLLKQPMRQVFFYALLFISFSSVFSQNESEKKEALRIKKIEERNNFQKLLDSSNF